MIVFVINPLNLADLMICKSVTINQRQLTITVSVVITPISQLASVYLNRYCPLTLTRRKQQSLFLEGNLIFTTKTRIKRSSVIKTSTKPKISF